MPSNLPMRCGRCGLVFPGPISSTPGVRIFVSNIQVPCPRCGFPAVEQESGEYLTSESGWRLIASALRPAGATATDYVRLKEALDYGRSTGASAQEMADLIARTAPKFRQIGEYVGSQQGASHAAWLALLLTLVMFILDRFGTSAPGVTYDHSVTVVNQVVDEQEILDRIEESIQQLDWEGRAGAPCPCGSGTRFDRCHGKSER